MSRVRRAALLGICAVLGAGLLSVVAPQSEAQAAEFYPVPAGGVYTLDGHGYGHGHGMSQYGAQGAATSGRGAAEILAFYYPGTTQRGIGNPTLRVKLTATTTGDMRVDSTQGLQMTVRDLATGATRTGPAGAYRVLTSASAQRVQVYSGPGQWTDFSLGGAGTYAGPLSFSTADGVTVFNRDDSLARNYRGSVQVVRTAADESTAVNHVTMEDYLKGVVPRESPAWFAPAALQAQAVAARSYAWHDVAVTPGADWDTCDTTSCQVYGGRRLYQGGSWQELEYASTTNAIASTAGIALYYGASPAFTQFSSSNGGAAVAGSQPYLAAFADPYDGIPSQNTNHNWTATLSAGYLQSAYPQIGTLTGIRILSRTGLGEWGGHITAVELVGTQTTVRVGARFNLKSTWWRPRDVNAPFGDLNSLQVSGTTVRLTGWTIDPDSSSPTDVHVYVGADWGGAYRADVARPDVGAAYPGKGDRHGFDITLRAAAGTRTLCVYAINLEAGTTNTRIACQEVTLGQPPIGSLDSVTQVADQATVTGWTIDPDTTDPIPVHVYVNGRYKRAVVADVVRADVGRAYPASGSAHGFSTTVGLVPGANTICVYAIDHPDGSGNPQLGCRTVSYGSLPVGGLDSVGVTGSQVRVVGWALDADTTASIDVHVYVDGALTAVTRASRSRVDISRAFPGYGSLHGYDATVGVGAGRHSVCVYAINVAVGRANPRIGCAVATVAAAPAQLPQGNIDSVAVSASSMTVSGWALDMDAPTQAIAVHVYVDGRWRAAVAANLQRADVGAAFPGAGAAHGWASRVAVAPGPHRVCAYGINVGGGSTNPVLRCVDVRVP